MLFIKGNKNKQIIEATNDTTPKSLLGIERKMHKMVENTIQYNMLWS